MSYRPDAPGFNYPMLLTERPIVSLSTNTAPAVDNDNGTLEVGATWFHEDTGAMKFWTGTAWKAVTVEQRENLSLMLLFDMRDAAMNQL